MATASSRPVSSAMVKTKTLVYFIKNALTKNTVLTSLGEKLTDKEVDELVRSVEVDKDGMIQYHEFVKTIMSG